MILDLGFHPPCDSLLTQSQMFEMERTYPLRFLLCRNCELAQIDYVVARDVLFFPGYPYRSGITDTLKLNLMAMAGDLASSLNLPEGALAIDLGSNDGTTLQGFKVRGLRVLGVEPTNVAQIAVQNGIPTLQDFFGESVAEKILSIYGKASVITATNVFAHVPNLGDLVRGVKRLLMEGGLFLVESHYLLDLLQTVQYDSIYHEHLKYYSLKTLVELFSSYAMTVTDAERIPNYGGSIRVYVRDGIGHPVSTRVKDLLREENIYLHDKGEIYSRFRDKVTRSKHDLLALLIELKRQGKHVVGVGCPGRSSTLINYCGIGPDLLPYIAEQSSSLKLGMFLPGQHIPIVDEKVMFEGNPDYVLMLSWHYYRPIVSNLRQKGLKSSIILPLPEVRILEE